MNFLDDSWLVGTSTGLYAAADRRWERLGAYQFIVTGFDRSGGRLLASTGSGLWEIRQSADDPHARGGLRRLRPLLCLTSQ
jgi:hypothetical protein